MCDKRERRPVIYTDMIGEEEITNWLLNNGITKEQLENDLGPNLTLEPRKSYTDSACIVFLDETESMVSAGNICELLDNAAQSLNENEVDTFFGQNEAAIGALVRHPGGYHEWLKVSAIPYLMKMKIPMSLVKLYRPETTKCVWINTLTKKVGIHGGPDSTTMHNDLQAYIKEAYSEYQEGGSATGSLADKLSEFNEKYWFAPKCQDTLTGLINALKRL